MMSQMQELVSRVHDALPGPWNKKTGRPKLCSLYQAVETTCMYIRHNGTQEFLGDLRDASQSTVSRMVSTLTPIVTAVLEEFVPDATEAIEIVKGRACLVDGTIAHCWSYGDHPELWSRKHGTTGFSVQLLSLLDGTAIYISDPLPGKTHDTKAFTETPVADIVAHSGGAIGDKGYQGHVDATPRKKPRGGQLSKADQEATPRSRRCEHLSSESSHTSSHGGYSTPTTAVPIAPTATRMTPPEDCSSSQLHGV
jgi:DDE superfamily endonuclease